MGAVSTKSEANVHQWDEICGEFTQLGDQVSLTRGDDDDVLVHELRGLNEEEDGDGDGEGDEDGDPYWELVKVVHLPRSTQVEWKSGRGHHSVTVVIWL